VFKSVFGAVIYGVSQLFSALKPMQPFIQNIAGPLLKGILVGAIATLVVGFHIAIFAVRLFANVLGFLGRIAGALHLDKVFYAIGLVIGTFFGPWILRVIGWLGKFSMAFRIIGVVLDAIYTPIRLVNVGLSAMASQIAKIFKFGGGGVFGTIRSGIVGAFKAAFLYLGRLPGQVGSFMMRLGIKIGDFLFTGMKERLIKAFLGGVAFVSSIGRGIKDWINKHTLFGDEVNVGLFKFHIPALASGGVLHGLGLVGENGPELAQHTSHGTVITPLRSNASPALAGVRSGENANFNGLKAHFTIPVIIGRKQVGEAVGEYISDRRSRA
jgi:hypothetical protein